MKSEDYKVINTFIDYHDHLTDGKFVEGMMGIEDENEVKQVVCGMATALTINKLLKGE